VIEPNCASTGGVFKGVGTGCDPNPCLEYQSSCLNHQRGRAGHGERGLPAVDRNHEHGTADFTFSEGGIIVQSGASSDVTVDIKPDRCDVLAGQSFVINSNASGACTGAFQAIYASRPI